MNFESHLEIAGRRIGPGHPPFIIAELSANHNGSIETAFDLIRAAKAAGADAVKIQTYRPDTITLDSDRPDFLISGGLWDGRRLYDLYQEAHTPWHWHKDLFKEASDQGIPIFSSPFDMTAVDMLEELEAPAYKIASFEAIDLPLIRYTAATGKPMIISTGMASSDEIGEAVAAAHEGGCSQLAILHCVSGYPAPAKDYNLNTIQDMEERYGLVTGLSDHTLENTTAIASVALGAAIIEKHFTLDRARGGPDDSFSLEAEEFANLCAGARTAWEALGKVDYGRKSSEVGNVIFRRSLYVAHDIKKGERLTPENIRSVRPGYGLEPKHYDSVLGKTAAKDLVFGEPLLWDSIEVE